MIIFISKLKDFNKIKNINFTLEKLVLITNLQYKLTKLR